MDEEENATGTTGQPQAASPAASEATGTRDVARRKPKKRGRGRPPGAKNKAKAPPPPSSSPAPSPAAPSSSPAAIEGDEPNNGEGGETPEGRSERYAEGRRAIADGAPAIERLLTPFAPAIALGLDTAAGTAVSGAPVAIHRTTTRGEPRTTTGTAAEAVIVALSEAVAFLTPSGAVAALDHPLAPALATVGGVAVAILGSRLAALLATLSSPAASSVEPSSSSDAPSSSAPSSSAASDAIEVRDASTGAPLQ